MTAYARQFLRHLQFDRCTCGCLFEHIARSNLFRSSFTVDHSQLWPASSFECLGLQLRCYGVSSTLRLFVIYRPPSSGPNSQPFAVFHAEFRDLVERVGKKSGIIIFGDFNVRYGDNNDARERALRDILSDAMRQNVTDATHDRGKCMNLLPNDTSGPDVVADRFAYHFVDKINSIRSQIQRPSANVDNAQPCIVYSPLFAFQPTSLKEVTTLIENGKTKSSKIHCPFAIPSY